MVRPLTKCRKDGARYVRPQAVEAEIEAALQQDLATLRERFLVTDRTSRGYLSSECLVHLIRDALRRTDDERLNTTLPTLLRRCEANLRNKIANSLLDVDYLREEVLSQFSELLASDGTEDQPDELDYYECRFNDAFSAFRVDAVRRELRRLGVRREKARRTESGGAPARQGGTPEHVEGTGLEDEREFAYTEAVLVPLSDMLSTPADQDRGVLHTEVLEAIDKLPTDERKAVVLCYVYGYKVESQDPDAVTAATLCECSGRTIRNRLSRAMARLSYLKEDACTPS